MKSRLLFDFDPEVDENRPIKKDLESFLGLSGAAREVCVGGLADFILADTPERLMRICRESAKHAGVAESQMVSALQVSRFFARAMLRESTREDTTQAWGADLVELGLLDQTKVDAFVEAIEKIRREVLPDVKDELRSREYEYETLSQSMFGSRGRPSELLKTKLPDQTAMCENPVEFGNAVAFSPSKELTERFDSQEFRATFAERISAAPGNAVLVKLEAELAAFEMLLSGGKLSEFTRRYVAIHRGQVLDSDSDEFRLAARVAPIAEQEGAIAIRRVPSESEREEDTSLRWGIGHFESTTPEDLFSEI